jgi:hypothetical protein
VRDSVNFGNGIAFALQPAIPKEGMVMMLVKIDRVRGIDQFIDYFGERRHDAATEAGPHPTANADHVARFELAARAV